MSAFETSPSAKGIAVFEHYMIHQASDPRRRAQLLLATVAATLGCSLCMAGMWGSNKLQLSAVDPPTVGNFEFAAISLLETPDLTKPPPMPEDPVEVEKTQRDDLFEVIENREPNRSSKPRDASDSRRERTDGLFERIGERSCPIGAVCDSAARGQVPSRGGDGDGEGGDGDGDGDAGTRARPVQFEQLSCRACADPAIDELRRTPSAAMHRSGVNETRFCVDESGRTYGVKTKRSIGDAAVDRICRDTVRRWRFAPMQIGGSARRACSSVRFDIHFDR